MADVKTLLAAVVLMVALGAGLAGMAEAREIRVCRDSAGTGPPPAVAFVWGSFVPGQPGGGIVAGKIGEGGEAAGRGSLYFPEQMLQEIREEAGLFRVQDLRAICSDGGLHSLEVILENRRGFVLGASIDFGGSPLRETGRFPAVLSVPRHPAARMDGAILIVSAAEVGGP
jgi:hypothetical protein